MDQKIISFDEEVYFLFWYHRFSINPFPNDKFLEFADDNFNFVENSRKLFKQVENTVGKGEIAPYEQFLDFPQCF